jgi:hypothetical protein
MDKKNETLEQRRKAQQEFLKLKKMQSGEITPPPKPSETAPALTKEEKKENFWYYNKGKVIFTVIASLILSVLVVQCATRPVYDGEVVLFTYDTYYTDHVNLMEDYFKFYFEDKNGDGKVNVHVINVSYDKNVSMNYQANQNAATKLSSLLLGQRETVLFLLDEESFGFLDSVSNENQKIFKDEKVYLGNKFYGVCDVIKEFPIPEGLFFVTRDYSNEEISKDKKIKESLIAAEKFLKNVKNSETK